MATRIKAFQSLAETVKEIEVDTTGYRITCPMMPIRTRISNSGADPVHIFKTQEAFDAGTPTITLAASTGYYEEEFLKAFYAKADASTSTLTVLVTYK